ncbi:hypothetical protein NJB1907f44_21610 [Mycobacterium marinum]|uniref:Uncharacterized protein n=1 Tax=Mycobacterium shottsii TaxID=133549 RepID=A0A7I7LC14_9MYCO|nr:MULTISPECIES: hypothetical protein [Mycobacterium ulcerans group]QYL27230.1 hypothetical protein TM48_01432 [Mycobacterium shottsii]RFZ09536.1 hypothetical protein VIMS_03707 [Mycobacterium marinum]RFZ42832.1 hypothetical protein KST_01360 [Mycobacterium marinum]WCS17546.1 hypothetical protein MML61_22555 [Mycobacterium marinum]BBX56949.1 hypothetical protein MSHO_22940 [Mycobacterium shottsii]
MWRRDDNMQPPPELLEYDGIRDGLTTPAAWQVGLEEWEAARRQWAKAHGVDEADLPAKIGDEPWDPDLI